MVVKKLEYLCKDILNIDEDICLFEIIKFIRKYDGYSYDVFFLINFNEERKLIRENDIKKKDRNKYKMFGFSPKPGLTNNPDYYILYCKFFENNKWEYLKIKSNKKTTEDIRKKDKKMFAVLVYTFEKKFDNRNKIIF